VFVACLFTCAGIVLIVCTTIPYVLSAAPVHPGGGGSDGAMEAVTACLATSWATGFAEAAAARARIA